VRRAPCAYDNWNRPRCPSRTPPRERNSEARSTLCKQSERRTVARSAPWAVRRLLLVPHGNDPNRLLLDAIEEAKGAQDNFAMRQGRKLGDLSSRARKGSQALQRGAGAYAEPASGTRLVEGDVKESLKELRASRPREANLHLLNSSSASARTSSRSWPLPDRASLSPRAMRLRISSPRSVCS